ncbi:MAG: Hsp20/alpha crystallin family protein [Candidatus Cloacimonetes bacterium]|nr:Hsp20/alpha crystallin family protein [Candidatus Cloacimonadota bacterium]
MKLVPAKHHREFFPMRSFFDEFVKDFYENEDREETIRSMALDILEHEETYEVLANLPGFKKKDISLSLDGNELTIEAKREEKKEEKKPNLYRCERYSGNYRRTVTLNDLCDVENISASYTDGVLSLIIPKIAPKPAKEIPIA